MARLREAMPVLTDSLQPPMIHGVAELTTLAYQGLGFDRLMERINRTEEEVARLYDTAIACQLDFRGAEGLNLQPRPSRAMEAGSGTASEVSDTASRPRPLQQPVKLAGI